MARQIKILLPWPHNNRYPCSYDEKYAEKSHETFLQVSRLAPKTDSPR